MKYYDIFETKLIEEKLFCGNLRTLTFLNFEEAASCIFGLNKTQYNIVIIDGFKMYQYLVQVVGSKAILIVCFGIIFKALLLILLTA